MTSTEVKSKTKEISAAWDSIDFSDLNCSYSIDITDEFSKILSQEMAKEEARIKSKKRDKILTEILENKEQD